MSLLDWIILGIIIISGVIGMLVGIKRKVRGVICFFGSFAVAMLFYAMLANTILTNTDFGKEMALNWSQTMIENAEGETKVILQVPYTTLLEYGGEEYIIDGFKDVGVPSFFVSFFMAKMFILDGTLACAITSSFVSCIFYAVSFVGLFLITYLVLWIIVRFVLKKVNLGVLNRLGGLVTGIMSGGSLVVVIMLILIGVSLAVPNINTWLVEQTNFNGTSVSISLEFYNWAYEIIYAFKNAIAG